MHVKFNEIALARLKLIFIHHLPGGVRRSQLHHRRPVHAAAWWLIYEPRAASWLLPALYAKASATCNKQIDAPGASCGLCECLELYPRSVDTRDGNYQ